MSCSGEEKVDENSVSNVQDILADFFLKKFKMPSHSDQSDNEYSARRKRSKHKKHKKSKHKCRSRSSSHSDERNSHHKMSEVRETSSSEEKEIERLKKIKKLDVRNVNKSYVSHVASCSLEEVTLNKPCVDSGEIPYGPSIELLLTGVESDKTESQSSIISDTVFSKELKVTEIKSDFLKSENFDSNIFINEQKNENSTCSGILESDFYQKTLDNELNRKKLVDENNEDFKSLNEDERNDCPKAVSVEEHQIGDNMKPSGSYSDSENNKEKIDKTFLSEHKACPISDSESCMKSNNETDLKNHSVQNSEEKPACYKNKSLESDSFAEMKTCSQSSVEQDQLLPNLSEKKEENSSRSKSKTPPRINSKTSLDGVKSISSTDVTTVTTSTSCKKKTMGAHIIAKRRSCSRSVSKERFSDDQSRSSRSKSRSRERNNKSNRKHHSSSRSRSRTPTRRVSHSRSRSKSRIIKTARERLSKRYFRRSRSRSWHRRNSRSRSRQRNSRSKKMHSRSRSRNRSSRSRSRMRSRSISRRRRSRSRKRRSRSRRRGRYKSWKRSRSTSVKRSRSGSAKRSRSRSRKRYRSRSSSSTHGRSQSSSEKHTLKENKSRLQNDGKIDQAEILQIARKNMLTMMEKGTLPEGIAMENLKKEHFVSIKSGGKSVQELTDFCLKLSKKENDPCEETSEKNDDDNSTSDSGFIHHPFKLKEQSSIKLNIKSSVQLPVKTHAEKIAETARLSSRFPVSSGNQHKQKELEWIPVEPDKTKVEQKTPALKVSTDAKQNANTVVENVTSIETIPVPLAAPLPPPPPLPVSYPCVPEAAECNLPMMAPPQPPPMLPPSCRVVPTYIPSNQPEATVTNSFMQPSTSVFKPPKALDIASIVTMRFRALTKLQANPNDPEALSILNHAQASIQEWVQSQQVPGLFTGSTDAKLLSVEELCGPKNYKIKKDIFSCAAPVTGGKGMSLLKKMGWNPGEGLGKNKEGSLEPLVLNIKTDKKGLVSQGEGVKKLVSPAAMQELQGKHPVSALMELCSKRKWKPPLYTVVKDIGPPHRKIFLFKVEVNNVEYQPVTPCSNKKQAKADAAIICLQALNVFSTGT